MEIGWVFLLFIILDQRLVADIFVFDLELDDSYLGLVCNL